VHRVRELLVSQRTQYINQARGLLAERGYVAARRDAGFTELLARLAEQPTQELTPSLAGLIGLIVQQIRQLDAQIKQIERQLQAVLAASPVAQRVDGVFAVGFITATAFAGEYGACLERFADARQFAASLGITPSEHSSGEKRRLGAITKRGNAYLRRLLVQCAQVVLLNCERRDDALCLLARRLLAQRKRRSAVVVAVANRLARIIYAVIKHGEEYRPHPIPQPL
jgi:transposase